MSDLKSDGGLKVEAKDSTIIVYSKDLKSDDPDIKPVYDNIPIVKLAKGQRIVLEAYAKLGRGKDHIKWQPAIASYYYYPKVIVKDPKSDKCRMCVEICPEAVRYSEDKGLEIIDVEKCTFNRWKTCEQVCEGAIEVDWEPNKYIFWIESFGNMPIVDIVEEAFRILKLKFKEFLETLETQLQKSTSEQQSTTQVS